MVVFFKDLTKPVKNILEDDFDAENKVTASVGGVCGVKVKVEDNIGDNNTLLKKTGGKLTVKYAHNSGFSVDKLALDGKGVKLETSLSKLDFAPGLKILYKGNPSCTTVGAEFQNKTLAADFSVDSAFSKGDASVAVAQNEFTAGTSLKFADTSLSSYKLGVSWASGPVFSGLTFDNNQTVGLALTYKACPPATIATSLTKSGTDLSVVVGTTYKCNPSTTIKAVTDTKLDMKVACIQELEKKTTIAGSAIFNAKNIGDIKYGVAFTMG